MDFARLPSWSQPAPDSALGETLRQGRPAWTQAIHLLWTVWVFITPMFVPQGYDLRWLGLTVLSYPLFAVMFAGALVVSQRRVWMFALAMIALCFALMPWYPSALSYFVFGCVVLGSSQNRLWVYVLQLLLLNALLLVEARVLGYPWTALAWMPVSTLVIGTVVHVDRITRRKDVALRLSHEEVRRLAALAERERIGRDLHDLLGHTLSMVALKSDLAGRLLLRDPDAARNEIDELGRVARDALAQVRRAVSGIRASGIAAELASAKLLLETDGVAFDYRFEAGFADGVLPPGVETVLALAVREAATNIQRHARAQRAEASFGIEGREAVLRIADDGLGGEIAPGNGLSGMRERVRGLRGRLHIGAGEAGRGTRLEVRVPLAANDDTVA